MLNLFIYKQLLNSLQCQNETEQEVPVASVQPTLTESQMANSPSIEDINKSQTEEILHLREQIASLEVF